MKLQDQINFLTSFIDKAEFSNVEMTTLTVIRDQLKRIKKGGRPRKWESDQERWAYYNARRKQKRNHDNQSRPV